MCTHHHTPLGGEKKNLDVSSHATLCTHVRLSLQVGLVCVWRQHPPPSWWVHLLVGKEPPFPLPHFLCETLARGYECLPLSWSVSCAAGGGGNLITCMALSPDGSLLAASGPCGVVSIFSVEDFTLVLDWVDPQVIPPQLSVLTPFFHSVCIYFWCLFVPSPLVGVLTFLSETLWVRACMFPPSPKEKEIEEFWSLAFTPDSKKLFVSGKRKSRRHWDTTDGDNKIKPCHIKVWGRGVALSFSGASPCWVGLCCAC